ncbi:NADP-dependent malic enzyme-like [Drosophila montana]|uniref:NADP-dependent malic enzyme-like n=1 Tax=Drosophila montana TaxID=40370 RepID=UPI00313CEFFF
MAYSQLLVGIRRNFGVLLCAKPQKCEINEFPNPPKRYRHANVIKADYRKVTDPHYNKGMGYTHDERQRLNVIGLMPCAYRSETDQLDAVNANFQSQKTNLGRYLYLRTLRSRQERLYYRFVTEKIEDVMPIIYTPTVGAVCQAFSLIYHSTMGLYVSKYDKGYMTHVLSNWPSKDIRAVCVTDGERILGLGDLGAGGMGISVGKLDLYTALAKVPPQYLIPVVLDVGTNNKQLLSDPLYIGVREERCKGKEYEDLVQEFMESVVKVWGYQTLIHFEDFATPNAFKFINMYQDKFCYINDDIQGTASCGLAGFLAVEHITKKPLKDHVVLFVGAGSAALGISKLLVKELISRKISEEDAVKNIYITDVEGLITKDRKEFAIPDLKLFAKDTPPIKDLEELVKNLKPSIILGATGQGGIFTENILRIMGTEHKQPAIFACSNPTNKAECTAEQAYNITEGRALFASGSPFPPVVINGKRLIPTQANNAFAFPGVALGVLCTRPRTIPDKVFLVAAHEIAKYSREFSSDDAALFPPIKEAANVAFTVAVAVAKLLIDEGNANVYPIPTNICEFVQSYQYYTDRHAALPSTWKYPEMPPPLPKGDDKGCKI